MRGACGIVLDCDKALISFAHTKFSHPTFICESQIPLVDNEGDILTRLKKNLEIFDEKINDWRMIGSAFQELL